jgi:probable F420-dependent oxidoreductase
MNEFGVTLSLQADGAADPSAEARRLESLGFDFVSMWDHLPGTTPAYETWTTLTWVAARTDRIRLLTNVLGLPYRSPAVLAKMAESLQRLSGGRLILGLGAGGNNDEFRALGLPERTPAEKIVALDEALQIIKRLWHEDEPFSFEGRHYQVHDAVISPKPEAPIPIWLGSYGPKSLKLLGREADGWIPSLPYMPPDRAVEAMDTIKRAAKDAGRDPSDITLGYNVGVKVGEGATSSRAIAGPAKQVAEKVHEFLDLGFSAINFWVGQNREEQHERLASDVLPLLR